MLKVFQNGIASLLDHEKLMRILRFQYRLMINQKQNYTYTKYQGQN